MYTTNGISNKFINVVVIICFIDSIIAVSSFSLRNGGGQSNSYTPQANPVAPKPDGMFFPKNQNEIEQPKGGSIESLFSDHAEAPLAHRDVYPKQQLPTPTTKKGVNNTLSSSDQVHHYGNTPSVNITNVMDVGTGEKKKNVTASIPKLKNEKPVGAMNALKEELVEEHGKLPKAHASDDTSKDDDGSGSNNKGKGNKKPKEDPAWKFMMSNIKKDEAPATPAAAIVRKSRRCISPYLMVTDTFNSY